MRKITVPIDMASEQKSIFSVLSIRQLIYIVATGQIVYQYVTLLWKILYHINIIFALAACGISIIPAAVFVFVFAFYYKAKHFMYFDRYLLVRLARKNGYGKWRRGQ